jgi:hypothetical protein
LNGAMHVGNRRFDQMELKRRLLRMHTIPAYRQTKRQYNEVTGDSRAKHRSSSGNEWRDDITAGSVRTGPLPTAWSCSA